MIGLINYGSGNISAIADIYRRLGVPHRIVSSKTEFNGVSKLILPGVGAFDETMILLNNSGFTDLIQNLVLYERMPILGICVGMQVLANSSQEGKLPGLGLVEGAVLRMDCGELPIKPRLPHMGWNSIQACRSNPIFDGIDCDYGFYFLHSYEYVTRDAQDIAAHSFYGHQFCAAVARDNILGVQFHPEKGHDNGIKIFENFAKRF